jgi:hypothetical protein
MNNAQATMSGTRIRSGNRGRIESCITRKQQFAERLPISNSAVTKRRDGESATGRVVNETAKGRKGETAMGELSF